MKEEYDFNRIGKRLPYTAPEGFLDDIETIVWATLKDEIIPKKTRRSYRLWYSISGGLVAASIALLLVFKPLSNHQNTSDFEPFEQAFTNLSTADQDYLLTIYQDDLFIND
ncbi:MAG: hypothetical protein ACK5IJ_04760 [Mangrovibacterium sp.]